MIEEGTQAAKSVTYDYRTPECKKAFNLCFTYAVLISLIDLGWVVAGFDIASHGADLLTAVVGPLMCSLPFLIVGSLFSAGAVNYAHIKRYNSIVRQGSQLTFTSSGKKATINVSDVEDVQQVRTYWPNPSGDTKCVVTSGKQKFYFLDKISNYEELRNLLLNQVVKRPRRFTVGQYAGNYQGFVLLAFVGICFFVATLNGLVNQRPEPTLSGNGIQPVGIPLDIFSAVFALALIWAAIYNFRRFRNERIEVSETEIASFDVNGHKKATIPFDELSKATLTVKRGPTERYSLSLGSEVISWDPTLKRGSDLEAYLSLIVGSQDVQSAQLF